MTPTPEQIEAVARAMWLSQYPSLTWELDANSTAKIAFRVLASAAITAMRPSIRDEVLEEAAKRVAELPMIVGIPGLPYERHRNSFEYAAAIRALKEKT